MIDKTTRNKGIPCKLKEGDFVISIIICDDDINSTQKIQLITKTIFEKKNEETVIRTYTNADEISTQILASCDLALLDIDLKVDMEGES